MNRPVHILVACHAWYGDIIGGAFRLATEFAQHLAAAGFQVSYACCANEEDSASETPECRDGVNIYRYPQPAERMNRLQRLRYHVRQTEVLARRIHQEKTVTAVSSHSPLQGLGAARALSGRGPFINYTVHSPFDDELLSNAGQRGPGLTQKIAGRIARWVDRRNVDLADRVQTDSRYTLANFQQKHAGVLKKKGIVAPGWVESDLFVPVENRREIRRSLGPDWDTDVPVLFTLRRLESRMGLDSLIHACERLAAEELPFRTLIGGGGSMKEELQQMIDQSGLNDHVRLLGRLPEHQLATTYAAADCFVLPTRALECFGLIVLEAYSCNTPVVASAAAAIPELAERQGSEWMFPPGDVDQLTERLRSFLNGTLQPTQNLRNIALEFDRKTILQRWESLLELPHPAVDTDAVSVQSVGG